MIQEAILMLIKKEDLPYETARAVMEEIMSGKAQEDHIAFYLTALAEKGETSTEIVASASVMREHCYKLPQQPHTMEIVGTGGDKSNTFNISTTSAIVLAAAGVPIAKHGNRAASSQCGSADVLEALGVNLDIAPEKSLELLEENNICFLFAQKFHPAMKHVAPVRKKLGIRTIFNLLGPLTNPLGAEKMLLGLYDPHWIEPMSDVLKELGISSAMIVHGNDGLDEISMSATTQVCELRQGKPVFYTMTPMDFHLPYCQKEALLGGTPQENAQITRDIFRGNPSDKRNAVVANAAAALFVYGGQRNLDEAIETIGEVLDSGKAMETLDKFIQLSNK